MKWRWLKDEPKSPQASDDLSCLIFPVSAGEVPKLEWFPIAKHACDEVSKRISSPAGTMPQNISHGLKIGTMHQNFGVKWLPGHCSLYHASCPRLRRERIWSGMRSITSTGMCGGLRIGSSEIHQRLQCARHHVETNRRAERHSL